MAALSILLLHLAIIVFNIAGCIAIPVGVWRHWNWVRDFWWRLVHLVCWAVVAVQALLDRACFLTIWQADLSGVSHTQPLIAHWIDRLIYLPIPLWVFAIIYVVLFLYVIALWVFVRPRRPWGDAGTTRQGN
ncbi:MAG: DUF2784 domain-containing protein [Rhodanobacteraceae bacterium]